MSNAAIAEKSAESSRSLKTFRNSADIEAFYRFVHENDLRREARLALEVVVHRLGGTVKKVKSKKKGRKKKNLQ